MAEKQEATPAQTAVAAVVVVIGAGVLMAWCSGGGEDRQAHRGDARVVCMDHVRDQLRDPGSAEFSGWGDSETAVDEDNGTFEVRGWVDADSALGGTARHYYTCVADHQGDGEYTLEITRFD